MFTADLPPKPDQWEITPIIEHRFRVERKLDRDFLDALSDNATDWHFRTRLGLNAKDKDGNKFVFLFQFGSTEAISNGRTVRTTSYDVNLANWERTFDDWTLTLGRQGYKLADGRLICSQSYWGNLGRTFEGARVRNKSWEFFAFKEAVSTPRNQDLKAGVVSHTWEGGQTSVIYTQNDRTPGTTKHYTLNHVYKRPVGRADLTLEGSVQGGRFNGADHGAFAGTVNLSSKVDKTVTAFVEASVVSGSSGPKSGAFDAIYPSPILPHGMRSQVGFKNLKELTFGAFWQPDAKLKVDGFLTFVGLFDSKDAWYGIGGSPNRRQGGIYQDPTGASGSQVGSYLQFEGFYKLTKHDTLSAGLGFFFPGTFIKRQLGTSPTTQNWGYLGYAWKF